MTTFLSLLDKLHSTGDLWEHRVETLSILQDLSHTLNVSSLYLTSQHLNTLSTQLLDPRSKVAKEASRLLISLAEQMGQKLILWNSFMKGTLKGLGCANSVLKQLVHNTLLKMITQCNTEQCLSCILNEFESKNNYMRERVSEYLIILLQNSTTFPFPDCQQFKRSLLQGINDKVEHIRKNMRQVFLLYQKRCPSANKMLKALDPSIVRLLHQEFRVTQERQSPINNYFPECNKENEDRQLNPRRQHTDESFKVHISRKSFESRESSRMLSHLLPINTSKRNSFHHNIPALKAEKLDDVEFLINSLKSQLWSTRLMSLERLLQIIQKSEHPWKLSLSMENMIIKSLVMCLEDSHHKVMKCAAEGVTGVFPDFPKELLKYCYSIVRRCIRGLTDRNKGLYQTLLSVTQSFNLSQVFQSVLKILEESKPKEKLICLDLVIEMLEFDPALVHPTDVTHIFRLMTNLISEDKSQSIPALAVISILKNIYPNRMWGCFINLSASELQRIVDLAAEIDPSLEAVIVSFTKTSPGKRPENLGQQRSNEMSLLSVSELEAMSRNPEFINEYIDVLHSQVISLESPCLQKLQAVVVTNNFLQPESIYRLFEMFHLSSTEQVLMSLNSIFRELSREGGEIFVSCLVEVVRISAGIHLHMYLDMLQDTIKHCESLPTQVREAIVEGVKAHLQSGDPAIRRSCVVILGELSLKVDIMGLGELSVPQRKLVNKYKQLIDKEFPIQ